MTTFIQFYRENKGKHWDYYELCKNPQVQLEDLREFPIIHYESLSSNPNITWDYVMENKDKKWSWSSLSENPIITMDIVIDNPDELWHYDCLSLNPNNNQEFVKEDIIQWCPYDFISLCSKPNITLNNILEMDIIRKLNEVNYPLPISLYTWENCISNLSANPSVTWNDIIEHPELPWVMEKISYNPNITMDIIDSNPDYEWSDKFISLNPNISWDIVKQNKNKWNYPLLSRNSMGYFNWDTVASHNDCHYILK